MVRLDKWLWYARVVKTRSLAQKLVKAGKVRLNKVKTDSPSAALRPGDVLTISLERAILVYKVLAEGERRGPYSEARLLYEDISPPPMNKTEQPDMAGVGPSARPNKHDRKQLRALKETGNN